MQPFIAKSRVVQYVQVIVYCALALRALLVFACPCKLQLFFRTNWLAQTDTVAALNIETR
jgi:hypothetical protein